MSKPPFITLTGAACQVILDCSGDAPSLLYWGESLDQSTTPEMLASLATRQEAPCCAAEESPISLSPLDSAGFLGHSGLRAHRAGLGWTLYPVIESLSQPDGQSLSIISTDSTNEIRLEHSLNLDESSAVLAASTRVTNTGSSVLSLDWCAAPSLPLPSHLDQLLAFEGRWANEFHMREIDRFTGAYVRENRCGRTSHDSFPGLVCKGRSTNESQGEAYAFHLGWSGNHRIHSEVLADGRGYIQMGELLYPGEISLAPGESYESPTLFGAYSSQGLNPLSQRFHRYVREQLSDKRMLGKARPVHYNTWEAVYFDHDSDKLFQLAEEAAAIGAERFVLDDGWFKGRRNDQAGLGDWTVDSDIYPDGLKPLIDKVSSLGLEFGLWFEPEMVNPDSDLYRAHPEWVLGSTSGPQVLARNQLVLNLSLAAVQDYLYRHLDALLSTHDIAYIKWDMNRELHQAADQLGRAAVHRQTHALYQLLERLRQAHPNVEIESCASGGGRADFGILQHTDRVWTSDSNDALDRLAIQKGFSMFFPAEFMGSHVGPFDCHITGRKIDMSMRAGVALFGHMGLEVNLLELADAERSELKTAIELHKHYRELIHSGDLFRLDTPSYSTSFGVIATDKSTALFSYALTDAHLSTLPVRLRFDGLEAGTRYRIERIWPLEVKETTVSVLSSIQGAVISGDALMKQGLQMPLMMPENLLLFALHAEK